MTKDKFLEGVQNWNNHLFCLWPALEATKGDVIEMGMGGGSTPQLHQYCADTNRRLFSLDNNLVWVTKFKELETRDHQIQWVTDWDIVSVNYPKPDVLLIDHAPGERRWIDVERFSNSAKIIVIHDSEEAATGYMLNKIWPLFKYRVDHQSPGAWASCVSNFIDVTKFEV